MRHDFLPAALLATALLGAFATFSPASGMPQAPATAEPGLAAARLERWLEDGDTTLITQSLRRHPEQVLPFFDRYLETGLKLIEGKATYEDSMKELRKGVRFGQLATDAFRDPIFAEYAANFAGWSTAEQRNFRAGQQAFKEGARAMKGGKPDEARVLFQQSFDLAEPLGDVWGMQMALRGLADAAMALQDWSTANDVSIKGMDLSSRLQLRTDEIEMILICVEARKQLKTPDSGLGHARLGWSKVKRSDPPELRRQVAEALVATLERMNQKPEATKIRAEAGLDAATGDAPADSAPQTPPTTGQPKAPSNQGSHGGN